jgi:hypothetical protein
MLKNPEAVLFDSRLDSAVIGLGRTSTGSLRAIYSKAAILKILHNLGITEDDLTEYYNWHIQQVLGHENSPIVFDDVVPEDI